MVITRICEVSVLYSLPVFTEILFQKAKLSFLLKHASSRKHCTGPTAVSSLQFPLSTPVGPHFLLHPPYVTFCILGVPWTHIAKLGKDRTSSAFQHQRATAEGQGEWELFGEREGVRQEVMRSESN